MQNFNLYTALTGGALIGLSASLLLFNGHMTGISGILNGLLNHTDSSGSWRYYFISGLLLGAAIYQLFNSDSFISRQDHSLWLIALSGFLVGFGAH